MLFIQPIHASLLLLDPLKYLNELDEPRVTSPLFDTAAGVATESEADIVLDLGGRPLSSRSEAGGGSFKLKSRRAHGQPKGQGGTTGVW